MKVIRYMLLGCYMVLVLVTTMFLFTFNQFSNSQIGNKTLFGLKENVGTFHRGDFIMSTKQIDQVKTGDEIMYYDTVNGKNQVQVTTVEDVMKTNDKEYTYVIQDGLFLSSEYFIGEVDQIHAIPFLGYLYLLFTSKLGYFVFIILPIVISFIFLMKKYRGSYAKKNKNQKA